jgi:DNA-directed RNA polymerase subunit RPC12/RpoP
MSYEITKEGLCEHCEAPLERKYDIHEPTGGMYCPECGVRLI